MGIMAGAAILLGHLRIMGRMTVETGLGPRMVEVALITIKLAVGAPIVAHQPVDHLVAGGAGGSHFIHGCKVDFRGLMRCVAWDARLQGVVLLAQARVAFQAGCYCLLAFRQMLGMTCRTACRVAVGSAFFGQGLRHVLMAGCTELVGNLARVGDIGGTMRFVTVAAVFRRHLGTVGVVTAQAIVPSAMGRMADAAVHGPVSAVKRGKGIADRTVTGQAGRAYRLQCGQVHFQGRVWGVAVTAPLDDKVCVVLR